MPRQQTYGKRSKAIYSAIALSSPDQPSTKPVKRDTAERTPIKANESRKRANKPAIKEGPERSVLKERSHNAVVQPVEIVHHLSRKSKSSEADPAKKPEVLQKKPTKLIFNDDDEGHIVAFGPDLVREVNPSVNEQLKSTPKPKRIRNKATEAPLERREDKIHINSERQKQNFREERVSKPVEPDAISPSEEHCKALLSLSQHPLTDFDTWSSQLSEHFDVTKIAEASFGEVYRLSLREVIPEFSKIDESVFKIIPLYPAESMLPHDKRKRATALKKAAELMSKPRDVANEVKLLQRMSAIPGFTNFRDVRILQGRPPEAFITAYSAWNAVQKAKKKDLSQFPDPAKKSSYLEDQLWAVIEMQDAGTDLERLVEDGTCTLIWVVWDTFWQAVLSLAKGEESAEFEHRDLHLGNICVRAPPPTTTPPTIDTKRKLNFTTLETTIIDYTISRCAMPDSATAYTDLSLDPGLFQGDSTDEYQYDIYRYMRSILFFDKAMADYTDEAESSTGRNWEQYHPQTNLVWLHLILYKLLEQMAWPSMTKAPNRKTKKEEYKAWKRANDLEHVLLKVQDLLDPGMDCWVNGVSSAGDLVLFALQEGWLDVEDVVGHRVDDEDALVSQLDGLEL